jgi:hypothetical protein
LCCACGHETVSPHRKAPPNDELQRTSDGNAAGSPLNSVFGRPIGEESVRLAIATASLALLCVGCKPDALELPTPKTGSLGFACYPVQFMRPPMGPPLRSCDVANPDTAVVVMDVGGDGRILKATIPQEPSDEMSACLAEALALWRLEPARDCAEMPLRSRYEMSYRDVFGWSPCLPARAGQDAGRRLTAINVAGGRTSGCS